MILFNILKAYALLAFNNLYSLILLHTRHDDYLIDEEKYQHIRKCAATAYPGEDLDYVSCETLDDWLDAQFLKRGNIYVFTGADWYLIILKNPHFLIYDYASATKRCTDVMKTYVQVKRLIKGKKAFLLCKEDTSYPLMLKLEKRGDYKILKDEYVEREDGGFHKLMIKVGD